MAGDFLIGVLPGVEILGPVLGEDLKPEELMEGDTPWWGCDTLRVRGGVTGSFSPVSERVNEPEEEETAVDTVELI